VPRRFPITIFLSAFLLFLVQPLMGRYILPWFGGGPAVWTTCMLFFQMLLLAGYAYAHWLGSVSNTQQQARIHIALLALSLTFLPLVPRLGKAIPGDPSAAILLLLFATVGGPYFLLSATGPLLQRWFTLSAPQSSPWRLYALSNLGSFLALLSYPFLLEPYLRLHTQGWIWTALYVVFAGLCAWTAWQVRPAPLMLPEPAVSDRAALETRPGIPTIIFWLALSAASSTVLLATTNQISQEIAVNPFLWVVPLSIYLLTFILTFERARWYMRSIFAIGAGIMAPVACAVMGSTVALALQWQLAAYLAALFIVCMLCHGELALSRPGWRHLTTFYLTIATGGALGAIFVALIAPRIFTEYGEFQIGMAAACFAGFLGWLRTGALQQWTTRGFSVRVPLMALLLGSMTAIAAFTLNLDHPGVDRFRNFYGILRVSETFDSIGPLRQLVHGAIRHGYQYLREPQRGWPTSYYGPHSGVGIAISALDLGPRKVAIIGLGAGTLAAWGREGDTYRFYEINPLVENIARSRFTYLSDTRAHTEVVLGDARVSLEKELAAGTRNDYDLIAVDAFSSDSIPLHLLTAECAELYRHRLKPTGALLLHISNRTLQLNPVTRGLAQHLGWKSTLFIAGMEQKSGESASNWVLITPSDALFEKVKGEAFGWPIQDLPPILWTDDFASLWHVFKF
jgi:hypothetical protein